MRGPQVMAGYWQRPEATTEVIDRDGWFATGDIALVQPDGYMRIVDRKKDMIVVSGFNVYPNELEDVLVAHPDVVECAAIGVPSESTEAIRMYVVRVTPISLKTTCVISCAKGSRATRCRSPSCSRMSCRRPRWARFCDASCAISTDPGIEP